ncbi:hypothetical protein GMLC_13180 [Geomonas limicola]|uniref:Uncharacterized protein n=1 Tax=Geomonas limicola TaxID=2740186 RepID=A0A6V8N8U9_9BACT|nr:hypothetical protein GMLC_13180 [Geomonas limicola]
MIDVDQHSACGKECEILCAKDRGEGCGGKAGECQMLGEGHRCYLERELDGTRGTAGQLYQLSSLGASPG